MKKLVIITLLLVVLLLGTRLLFGGSEDTWICDQENGEWMRHGNPSAEKPVSGCGEDKTQEENTDTTCRSQNSKEMSLEEARIVAKEKCLDGVVENEAFCNPNSRTWWFEFTPNEEKDGCNPACVVFVETKETEINWRCTGLKQID